MTDFRKFIPALPKPIGFAGALAALLFKPSDIEAHALSAAKAAYAAAIEDAARICKGYAAEHPDLGYGAGDCAAAIRALDQKE